MSNFAEALLGKTIKAIYPKPSDTWSLNAYTVTDDDMTCDGGTIILEFTDGTTVEIWNSEWGGMRYPDEEPVEKEDEESPLFSDPEDLAKIRAREAEDEAAYYSHYGDEEDL